MCYGWCRFYRSHPAARARSYTIGNRPVAKYLDRGVGIDDTDRLSDAWNAPLEVTLVFFLSLARVTFRLWIATPKRDYTDVFFFVAVPLSCCTTVVYMMVFWADHSNQNPRCTRKPCIPQCYHTIFGSDYCVMGVRAHKLTLVRIHSGTYQTTLELDPPFLFWDKPLGISMG